MEEEYWADLITKSIEAMRQGQQLGWQIVIESIPWWMWVLLFIGAATKFIKRITR